MRRALALVTVGMLVSTAHAEPVDPFAVRNPVPNAPPSVKATVADEPATQILDPGMKRRHAAMVTATAGGLLLVSSGFISLWQKARYDQGLARYEATGDVSGIDQANDARLNAKWYGTSLFLTGAAAVTVGAVMYFTAPGKIRKERVSVVPAVGGDSVSVSVSGGF